MKNIPHAKLIMVAKKALLSAGAIIKKGFSEKRRVTYKSSTSPVTHIDLMAEKKVIGIIRSHFPDHEFLAEESDFQKHGDPLRKGRVFESRAKDNYRWVIDPLDGTVNFVHSFPQVSVSVAVERNGVVLAGGVYDPLRDELFMAAKGKGATLNEKRIHVSAESKLQKSLLLTGFPYDRRRKASLYSQMVKAFLRQAMDLRRMGSAAIDLAWIACGRAEGYWEYKLNPWDVAAGMLIVEEAGGRVSDFSGRKYQIEHPIETLATNGRIHGQILAVFRRGK